MQTGLVMLTAGLAISIAVRCTAFQSVIAGFFVSSAARHDLDARTGSEKARALLHYCRRNSHTAGVAVLKPAVRPGDAIFPAIINRMLKEAARRAIALKVASRILHGLRRTDVLVHSGEGGEIAVIFPEADRERLHNVLRRISNDVSGDLGIPLQAGSALFPEDALTYDDLLRVAGANLDQNTTEPAAPVEAGMDIYGRSNP